MPAHSLHSPRTPCIPSDEELPHVFEDHEFDQSYPKSIRHLSDCHWSPVEVCQMAAQFLVVEPGTRVLDIGCGTGKFCAIGAHTTAGHFTGVEQRGRFVKAAHEMLHRYGIAWVEIVHGNIADMSFDAFDAFYLFNPFEEHILPILRVDDEVEMAPQHYDDYTLHVQQQLEQRPMATRVVTYYGCCAEIPECYTCVKTAYDGTLKLWIKTQPCLDDDPESFAEAEKPAAE